MQKEIQLITNKLAENIDTHLKKIDIVIKKDRGGNKNKLGVLNYIGWLVVIIFIFFDVVGIISNLHKAGIILTIDDSKIDDIIQEQKKKDPLLEIATAFTDTSSFIWDEMISENYTILRCSTKRLCCLTSVVLRIFQSVVTIIFLLYIGLKHRVFYGILFMFLFNIAIGLLLYGLGIVDTSAKYIMCPMPSEYRELFEF